MQAEKMVGNLGEKISGPLLIKPTLFADSRGYFCESWNKRTFDDLLRADNQDPPSFVQDNQSSSSINVLRGLHYQVYPHAQGKLVRCIFGEIFDVAVDLRPDSPTLGQWCGANLSSTNVHQLWIPEGFAHGFLVISNRADVLYKTTDYWDKDSERSIRWNDPSISIQWPSISEGTPVLSSKDKSAPFFAN